MAAAEYTKVFADPYPNGWKAKPDLSTPYLTTIRDNHDATLRALESHLYDHPIISNFQDLLDVDIDDLSDGQMFAYNAASHKFVNVDPPSGGGGTSYSFEEKEVGTDEYGLTVYSKTIIELPIPGLGDHLFVANGSGGSYDVSTRVDNKLHRIYPKELSGAIYFDNGDEWPLNFVDAENIISGTPHSWSKSIFTHSEYSNYSTTSINVNAEYRYYDSSSSSFKYRNVDKIRFSLIYTKADGGV